MLAKKVTLLSTAFLLTCTVFTQQSYSSDSSEEEPTVRQVSSLRSYVDPRE